MGDAIETRLRVMTWNIWWRFGPWQERSRAIAATLAEADADIIALQEVWDDRTENFAAKLADQLGYHHVHAPGATLSGVTMGNAILSRWPIVAHDIAALYGLEDANESRVAVYAEIDGPRGKIPVFSTHLNWMQHHSHVRQKQVADLTQFFATMPKQRFPPILCGDFNADPHSDEIRMLTGQTTCPVENLVFQDAWAFCHPHEKGFTWDNRNPYVAVDFEPDRRLDYILPGWPRGRGAGHVVECRIVGDGPVEGIWPSDHYALVAELRY